MRDGSHVDRAGTNVIINTSTIKISINGIANFAILIMLTLVSLATTNKSIPTGGVTNPIAKLHTIIIPKWIGSIPKLIAGPNNNGTKIKIAAPPSKNIPIRSNRMFTIIKNRYLFVINPDIAS